MKKLLIVFLLFCLGCSSKKPVEQNLDSYFRTSDSLYLNGKYWDAIDLLDTIYKKDSLNPDVFYKKSLAYSNLDLREDAFKSIDQAIYLTRDSSKYYRARALLFYKYREIKFAVMDCDYAIKALNDTNALLMRAQFNLEDRRYDIDSTHYRSVINDCEKYIRLSKNKIGFAEFLKGKAYLKLYKLDSATYYIEKSALLGYTLSGTEQMHLEIAKETKKREDEMRLMIEEEFKREMKKKK